MRSDESEYVSGALRDSTVSSAAVAAATVVSSGEVLNTGAGKFSDLLVLAGGTLKLDGAAEIDGLDMESGAVFDWSELLAGTVIVNASIAGQKTTFSAVGNVVTDYTKTGGSLYIGDGVTVRNLDVVDLEYDSLSCGSGATIDGLTINCAGFGNNALTPAATSRLTLIDGWTAWGGDITDLTISQKEGGLAYLCTSGGGTVESPGVIITLDRARMTAGTLYLGEVNVGGQWDGNRSNNIAIANDLSISGGTLVVRNAMINNLDMTGGTIILADRGLYIKGEAPIYDFVGNIRLCNTTVNRGGTILRPDGTRTTAANVDLFIGRLTTRFELNNAKINTNIYQAAGFSATVYIRGAGTEFGNGFKLKTSAVEFDLNGEWFTRGCMIDTLNSTDAGEYRISGRLSQGEYTLCEVGALGSDLVITQALLDETPYNLKYKLAGAMPDVQYITIHNTANSATAMQERNYLNNRQDNQYISFHFAVDETQAVQIMPLNVHGWHAGDGHGDGNMKSIGVEICRSTIYSSDIYYRAEDNAVKLAAYLLYATGLTVDDLRMHYDWSGKKCPHRIIEDNSWESFKKRVAAVRYAMPVFKATFGGVSFDITLGESVEVDGYVVTLEEKYDELLAKKVANLSVRSLYSTNTELGWDAIAWDSIKKYAVRYVNDLDVSSGATLRLGDKLENSGGNAVNDAFGTVSTGGIVTAGQTGAVIFAGASNKSIAATWLKVTGGAKNIIYGGGDGQNVTAGVNLYVDGDSALTTALLLGGGRNSVVSAASGGKYAVNMEVAGGRHRYVYGGGDNCTVNGDISVILHNALVFNVFSGAGSGGVNGDVRLLIDLPAYNGAKMSGNFYGGTVPAVGAAGSSGRDTAISGSVTAVFKSTVAAPGAYEGLIFGGSRACGGNTVIGGDVNLSLENIRHSDNLKLIAAGKGNSAWIVGGGQAVNNGAAGGNCVVKGKIDLNLGSGAFSNVVGGGQAQGGSMFAVGEVMLKLSGATVANGVYGAGYAAADGAVTVNGDCRVTIHADFDAVTAIQGYVYAAGCVVGSGAVNVLGDAIVEFTGNGDYLTVGTVNALGKGNCSVAQRTVAEFNDFTGDFSGTLVNFDTLSFGGGSVNISAANRCEAAEWKFNLVGRGETGLISGAPSSFNLTGEKRTVTLVIDTAAGFEFDLMDVSDEDFEGVAVNLLDASGVRLGAFSWGETVQIDNGTLTLDADSGILRVGYVKGTLA
ncbi:MAG: N-acetylmuramoyl-L-alanine amidase [Victivallaceae bacterium]|nr:N-acetylmuramoyl-L-alanine amidase [Victivallaceae bacterium]